MDKNLAFRSVNEVKKGESEANISSVSGANRKRKWSEEEEQKAEESSDLDTSSDDDGDNVQEDEKEANQPKEPVCSSQEEKPEVIKEDEKTQKDRESKESNKDQSKIQISQHQKPSQPVVFVPVDRLQEIQVCAHVKLEKYNKTKHTTGRLNIVLPFIIWHVDVGSSAEATCAGRGAGHHGGSSRKSLRSHLRRNWKWKDNPSASVSV